MPGSNGNPRGMVVQPRDLQLLRELAVMRVIDREQAKTIAGFGSTTRVNARLCLLTAHGLLRRFFLGTTAGGAKGLYTLTEKGARLAEVPFTGLRRAKDEGLVADFFVQHQLGINEVYCALKFGMLPAGLSFRRWMNFREPLAPSIKLIPDGYAEFSSDAGPLAMFLEVDLGHERLKVWKEKVSQYIELARSGAFEREFHLSRFRVLVITQSEGRMRSLHGCIGETTDKIFWLSTLEAIRREGAFGLIWRRPRTTDPQTLIRTTP